MKSIVYVLAVLSSLVPVYAQTIHIANSNPGAAGGTNVYLGPDAINLAAVAASDGDIIYVIPSNVAYNYLQLNGKSVSLIGGGFNPDSPGGAVSTITAVSTLASNIRLSGLVVTGNFEFGGSYSNILIEK